LSSSFLCSVAISTSFVLHDFSIHIAAAVPAACPVRAATGITRVTSHPSPLAETIRPAARKYHHPRRL